MSTLPNMLDIPLRFIWSTFNYTAQLFLLVQPTAQKLYGIVETCGHQPFLKLRATSWALSHTKGYQFETFFSNNKFAQFAFSYIWLLMINDTHLCEDTDHVNDFSQ